MKLQLDTEKTYAIALEGGGARGSYQVGAWKALEEAGIRYHAVSGTSVGALNGALMVMGDLEKAIRIWENIRFSQVMDVDDEDMKNLLALNLRDVDWKGQIEMIRKVVSNRGFDITPLRQWVDSLVDEELIRSSERELFVHTYSISEMKGLELRAKELTEVGEIKEMLLASAYFPAFRNEQLGGKRYTDGGMMDVIPIHALVEYGCREIIAIRLNCPGVEKSFKVPRYVHVHTVMPSRELGGLLEFDAEQSRKNMTLGYYDTMRMLYGLVGELYYIDSQWTEDRAYQFLIPYLRRYLRDYGQDVSLTQINEKVLPKLKKNLECKGDYRMLAWKVLELAAEEAELDPFRIYTEDMLTELLEPHYGEHAGRYPKFLTKALAFRSSFVRSTSLWDRKK